MLRPLRITEASYCRPAVACRLERVGPLLSLGISGSPYDYQVTGLLQNSCSRKGRLRNLEVLWLGMEREGMCPISTSMGQLAVIATRRLPNLKLIDYSAVRYEAEAAAFASETTDLVRSASATARTTMAPRRQAGVYVPATCRQLAARMSVPAADLGQRRSWCGCLLWPRTELS